MTALDRVQRLREEALDLKFAIHVLDRSECYRRATTEVLDLLQTVFGRHRWEKFQSGSFTWDACSACGEEDWPCPDFDAAHAVLDALDPVPAVDPETT